MCREGGYGREGRMSGEGRREEESGQGQYESQIQDPQKRIKVRSNCRREREKPVAH